MIHIIDDAYIYIRPQGLMDVKTLRRMAEELQRIEKERPELVLRLSDVSDVTEVRFSFYDFTRYSEIRTYPEDPFQYKTAFYVDSEVKYGFARMCQMIIEDPRNTIRIFREMKEAARWLGISLEPLRNRGRVPSDVAL